MKECDGCETDVFGPAESFGELASLSEALRTASVVATKVTQCVLLTRWNFLAVVRHDVEMAISVLEEMAERFRDPLGVL